MKIPFEDQEKFETAKKQILGEERERKGIGTLSEKTVHAILKNYYAPDFSMQEISVEQYVADIFTGTEILEIQTRNFNVMRNKLELFLSLYPVTIVYPVPNQKWILWIDEQTGEISKKRKSPITANIYDLFRELYRIKMYLKNPNLHIRLVLMDLEEYRILNGWSQDKKKGSSRYDRIPTNLVREITIDCNKDYLQFLPYDLPDSFTSREFAKITHIKLGLAQTSLNLLHYIGVVERIGKQGNSYLYQVVE